MKKPCLQVPLLLLFAGIIFSGKQLVINAETSAVGGVGVEIQDAQGNPLKGYALDDCTEFYGDKIDHTVAWKGNSEVSPLAGKPIRLRFAIHDADLYSFRFAEDEK